VCRCRCIAGCVVEKSRNGMEWNAIYFHEDIYLEFGEMGKERVRDVWGMSYVWNRYIYIYIYIYIFYFFFMSL
jgi:hypothetical protein